MRISNFFSELLTWATFARQARIKIHSAFAFPKAADLLKLQSLDRQTYFLATALLHFSFPSSSRPCRSWARCWLSSLPASFQQKPSAAKWLGMLLQSTSCLITHRPLQYSWYPKHIQTRLLQVFCMMCIFLTKQHTSTDIPIVGHAQENWQFV